MKPSKKVMSDMVVNRPKKERPTPPQSPIQSQSRPLAKPAIPARAAAPERTSRTSPVERIARNHREEPERNESAAAAVSKRLTPPPLHINGSNRSGEPQKMGCALWILLPLCLAALTLVIGGLVSGAKVTVTPKSWKGTVDMTTTFVLGEKGVVAAPAQTAPAFYTATKKFTQAATVPAIETTITESFAEGTVRFYNTSAQSVTIPAKTQITLTKFAGGTTPPKVSYTTEKAITLAKGTVEKPTQKDVLVTAVKSGTVFNTQPTDFSLIKPVTGVTIRGVTAIEGGADPADRTISPEVLASTKAQLITRFDSTETLIARVVEDTPEDMIALPMSFTTADPEVRTKPSGESSVVVVAERTVTAILVKRTELAKLLGSRIGAPGDIGLTLNTLNGLTIVTTALGNAENIPKTLPVRITGEVTVLGGIPEGQILAKIIGKSRREAKAYIEGFAEVQDVDIHTVPFWRRILPLDATKISVTVLNP